MFKVNGVEASRFSIFDPLMNDTVQKLIILVCVCVHLYVKGAKLGLGYAYSAQIKHTDIRPNVSRSLQVAPEAATRVEALGIEPLVSFGAYPFAWTRDPKLRVAPEFPSDLLGLAWN
jgi:hypothetical protein